MNDRQIIFEDGKPQRLSLCYEYPYEYDTYYRYSAMQGDDGVYFNAGDSLKKAIDNASIKPHEEIEITKHIVDGIKNEWEVKKLNN